MPETNAVNISAVFFNVKNLQVLASRMLFNVEFRRQCQPLVYRPMPASIGAPRVLQHERHNVVVRVRGCRMTKIQAYLHKMQTQQGVRFCDMLVIQTWLG